MPQLEITEVVLIYCNIVKNNYQQYSRTKYYIFQVLQFGQVLHISPKNFIFLKVLTQNFHKLKYGLLTKILNYWTLKIK